MRTYTSIGTPILKPMVEKIRKQYPEVTCYGFANGDIMFDHTFPETMQYFNGLPQDIYRNMLLVGRRTNVIVSASYI